MPLVGQAALLVALMASAWSLLAGALGGMTRSSGLVRSAGRGLVASLALLLLSSAALAAAHVRDDFGVKYVADYSSRSQPLAYKLSALWAGQGGSLLFWALLLAAFGTVLVASSRRTAPEFRPWIYAVMGGSLFFFTAVTAVAANPFQLSPPAEVPPDGAGMNPLLQNFWMLIHPPTLYIGYVGCAVPFAFGMAALLSGRLDQAWVRAIRRWSLFAFAFLTLGIWLGAYWAYIELGWGGFWAWDPVENASLMPWLVLTAFVHSIIVQDRRGMLKIWNLALIITTFLLSIYGTFLTRSGIIQSVHAFSKSSIGNWFVGFLALSGLFSIGLLVRRFRRLRPEAQLESVLSRESTFLFGNLVLLGLTLIVFFLTMYPVFTQLWSGQQVTPQPIQYTRTTRPWFLLLILLMGASPLAAWRRTPLAQLLRSLLLPAAAGFATALSLALAGAREPWSLACIGSAVFVSGAVVTDLARMIRSRRGAAEDPAARTLLQFLVSRRRRLGGYLAHLAVALMVVGVAASTAYQRDQVFEGLAPGQTVTMDGYRVEYEGYDVVNTPEFDGARLNLEVTRPDGGPPHAVAPERRVYGRTRQPSTEVAILSTILPRSFGSLKRVGEDFYVIPASVDFESNQATIEIIVHPLINWLWLGGVVLLVATLVALWPDRREAAGALAALPQAAADAAS